MKKHIPLIALVLAITIAAGVVFSARVSAASAPGLFHNDERWYKDSTASLEIIDGIPYVPIDIFAMFSHIELSMDSRRGEFMLHNRTTGRYISVLYNERIATVDGAEEVYLNLYKLHGGYYYVPADYFCSVLDLRCEIASSSAAGYGATVRISDGNETKSLAELLRMYDPTSEESTTPPDTQRPPVSSGGDTAERTIYLTFNTVREQNTLTLLTTLAQASVQATFFFTPEEISQYPALVCGVIADGHTLAITCEESEGAEDFLRRVNAANELLYAIAKTTTRVVQLPGGTERSAFTEADVGEILAEGYVIWDHTFDVPDSLGYGSATVKTKTLEAIRQSELSVLRMSMNATVVKILPDLLGELSQMENYRLLPIAESTAEVRKTAQS